MAAMLSAAPCRHKAPPSTKINLISALNWPPTTPSVSQEIKPQSLGRITIEDR